MPFNFSYVIPGKLAGMARPGVAEELEGELSLLKRQGIDAIVSLTQEPLSAPVLHRQKFAYLHLPLPDFTAPTPAQIAKFVAFVRQQNDEHHAVAVHCGAGMGRTGTLLACYLVSLGESADEAVSSVRSIRPGSIETPEQEDCIRHYEASLRSGDSVSNAGRPTVRGKG
jgi:atypical dual specificity phosphatase